MLEKPYFIMLHCRGGGVTPLIDENDDVTMFGSVEEASEAACNNDRAMSGGYDLFMVGGGIDGGDGL